MPDIQPTEENVLLIQKSIRHWEELWEGIGEMGSQTCPLCTKYYARFPKSLVSKNDCHGCPVREKTGVTFCRNTPYYTADLHWEDLETDPETKLRKVTPEFQKAADAEIDFLVSLLPYKMQQTYGDV